MAVSGDGGPTRRSPTRGAGRLRACEGRRGRQARPSRSAPQDDPARRTSGEWLAAPAHPSAAGTSAERSVGTRASRVPPQWSGFPGAQHSRAHHPPSTPPASRSPASVTVTGNAGSRSSQSAALQRSSGKTTTGHSRKRGSARQRRYGSALSIGPSVTHVLPRQRPGGMAGTGVVNS